MSECVCVCVCDNNNPGAGVLTIPHVSAESKHKAEAAKRVARLLCPVPVAQEIGRNSAKTGVQGGDFFPHPQHFLFVHRS